ncbi:unnamed protein product [Toxocara canis]|uniref:Uncharacterized protein n=1 Tax=Toxocara canis TaxID=6265 RepID=A0A183U2N3_TOXCA|nr:unnamed protein product [Toxocara canis]
MSIDLWKEALRMRGREEKSEEEWVAFCKTTKPLQEVRSFGLLTPRLLLLQLLPSSTQRGSSQTHQLSRQIELGQPDWPVSPFNTERRQQHARPATQPCLTVYASPSHCSRTYAITTRHEVVKIENAIHPTARTPIDRSML